MSKLYVDELAPKTAGNKIMMPQGGIIQTQYTQLSSTSSISCTSNTDTEISVLSVNITPVSSSSIIKIEAMVNGEWGDHGAAYNSAWFFYRDSTKLSAPASGSRKVGILMGSALTYEAVDASSTPEQVNYSYFDAPNTTSQITYKVGVNHSQPDTSWYLNRGVTDADSVNAERGISLICVTEIAG